MWVKDLIAVGYEDIASFDYGEGSPCLGDDSLDNVYFHPALNFADRGAKSIEHGKTDMWQSNESVSLKQTCHSP